MALLKLQTLMSELEIVAGIIAIRNIDCDYQFAVFDLECLRSAVTRNNIPRQKHFRIVEIRVYNDLTFNLLLSRSSRRDDSDSGRKRHSCSHDIAYNRFSDISFHFISLPEIKTSIIVFIKNKHNITYFSKKYNGFLLIINYI